MNELKHISEFQTLLTNYQPSDAAKEALRPIKLALLLAPSSGGRNTIIYELLKSGEFHYLISDTTRQPRSNNGVMEQNGVEYWFRSEVAMLEDIRAGKLLEAEVIHGQQVSGISIRELEQAGALHQVAITDIDIGGLANVQKAKPDTFAILVLPPSFDEWQHRINKRGALDPEDPDELRRRLATAQRIFQEALTNSSLLFVVNNDLAEAVTAVRGIVRGGHVSDVSQTRGRQLAENLYLATKTYLASE